MISGPIQLIKYNNKGKMGSVSVQLVEWYKDKNVEWDQAQYNFQIE